MSRSALALSPKLASVVLLVAALGCSKQSTPSEGAPSAAAPAPKAGAAPEKPAEVKPASGGGGGSITCTKFATLDNAPKPRPPITTTVKGARVPAGGTEKTKKPQLYMIQYWTSDTPRVEVACTVRKQLESDGWTIESMTGAEPVSIVAKKGPASVEAMVGKGEAGSVTAVIVTPK